PDPGHGPAGPEPAPARPGRVLRGGRGIGRVLAGRAAGAVPAPGACRARRAGRLGAAAAARAPPGGRDGDAAVARRLRGLLPPGHAGPVASSDLTVRVRPADPANGDAGALARVLVDCVEGGASVGFMLPLTLARAEAFWAGMLAGAASGERIVLVAEE